MRHRLPAAARLATLLALLLHAPLAAATGGLEMTGAPTAANGLNARLLARGPEAAYFNPALLPEVGAQATAGMFVLVTRGDISLRARPAGSDVPDEVYLSRRLDPDGKTSRLEYRPLATASIPEAREDTEESDAIPYLTLGLTHPIYKDRIAFGVYAVLPARSFQEQSTFFSDEREQYFTNKLHFELVGDRLTLPTMAMALGGRITSWLSVGVGANLVFKTVVTNAAHLPDANDQREILANPKTEVKSTFAPYFALATRPAGWLRLAATVHLPSSLEANGESQIRFWNYTYPDGDNAVRQHINFEYDYQPLRVGLGAAVMGPPAGDAAAAGNAPAPAWEIGARAVLERWSKYRDRHAEEPLDAWSNTIAVGVGGSVLLSTRRIALDLAYTPSPVPDQIGRTNYVDNARVGASVSFETPVSLFGSTFGAGAYLHGQVLIPREVEKSPSASHPVIDEYPDHLVNVQTGEPIEGTEGLQTNNPGYPGFSSSGWILGAGFAARFSL
jgi:hypothetical protein